MTTSAPELDQRVPERLEAEFLRPTEAELRLIEGLSHTCPGWWDEEDEQLKITRYRTLNHGCCA